MVTLTIDGAEMVVDYVTIGGVTYNNNSEFAETPGVPTEGDIASLKSDGNFVVTVGKIVDGSAFIWWAHEGELKTAVLPLNTLAVE